MKKHVIESTLVGVEGNEIHLDDEECVESGAISSLQCAYGGRLLRNAVSALGLDIGDRIRITVEKVTSSAPEKRTHPLKRAEKVLKRPASPPPFGFDKEAREAIRYLIEHIERQGEFIDALVNFCCRLGFKPFLEEIKNRE